MANPKVYGQKTYEYLFHYFSNKILSGEWKMNDKLPTERDMAAELGVSRNSIRETMHLFEITGLIECTQGSGNYIRCQPAEFLAQSTNMIMALNDIHYSEIFHLRRGYEFTALRLAMTEITEEELEEMHQVLIHMDSPMSSKESAQLDVQFHSILMKASHNRLLIMYESMIGDLMNLFIKDFRAKILLDRRRSERLRKAHWGIYEALTKRDFESGREALEKHFEVVQEQLEKY